MGLICANVYSLETKQLVSNDAIDEYQLELDDQLYNPLEHVASLGPAALEEGYQRP